MPTAKGVQSRTPGICARGFGTTVTPKVHGRRCLCLHGARVTTTVDTRIIREMPATPTGMMDPPPAAPRISSDTPKAVRPQPRKRITGVSKRPAFGQPRRRQTEGRQPYPRLTTGYGACTLTATPTPQEEAAVPHAHHQHHDHWMARSGSGRPLYPCRACGKRTSPAAGHRRGNAQRKHQAIAMRQ